MVINFHDLYQKYAQDVYRFAYWLCGDAQDAEDITSETFVRALTSANEIRTETVKGYLLTIARNLAFKRTKRASRLADLTPGLPALGNGPEQTAEVKLSLQGVMQFMLQQVHPVHMLTKTTTCLSGNARLTPHDQGTADALLQQADALRHRRRGHAQDAGCTLETALAHHSSQRRQRRIIQHEISFS